MSSSPNPAPALREPANRVSARAPEFWRVTAAIAGSFAWLAAIVLTLVTVFAVDGWGRIVLAVVILLLVLAPVPWLTIAPKVRYAVHRWEVTDIAVHVRHGWITRTSEIVPLSRVQTVDSVQGPLMRLFGLRTVTVQTASRVGAVQIAFLDDAVARDLVAHLVAITSATPEDAT